MPHVYLPPMKAVSGYALPSEERLRELARLGHSEPHLEFVQMTAQELLALAFAAANLRAGWGMQPLAAPKEWDAVHEMSELIREQMNGPAPDMIG